MIRISLLDLRLEPDKENAILNIGKYIDGDGRSIGEPQVRSSLEQIADSDLDEKGLLFLMGLSESAKEKGLNELSEDLDSVFWYLGAKSLDFYPGCDPYTEQEDMAKLSRGVQRKLYTQERLSSVVETMKMEESFHKLREIHERSYKLDHTPFATPIRAGEKRDLEDYGYHLFIGREIFNDGHWNYVVIGSSGSVSFVRAEMLYEELKAAVKRRRSILLIRSPGEYNPGPNDPYRLAPRKYELLELDDLLDLKRKFEQDPEMKGYDNPFYNQPKGEDIK